MRKTLEALMACKNAKVLGLWTDSEGKYAPMLIFQLNEESA